MSTSSLVDRPVPVLIVAYKKPEQLAKCLEALRVQDTPVEPRIRDNSIDNIYYTPAVNHLLKQVVREGHEFAILLGQDCYLNPDAVSQMVRFMRSHPRCALAGIKQLLESNPDCIYHAGATLAFPQGHHKTGFKSRGDHAISKKVPWVNGSCVICRIDAVIEFGLLDQNMLLVGLDSDWCYTARLRGWEVWYCAEAECTHSVGISGEQPPPEILAIGQRDMTYWQEKWLVGAGLTRLEQEFPVHIAAGIFKVG